MLGVLGFLYVPDYGGDEVGCSQRLDFWFLGTLAGFWSVSSQIGVSLKSVIELWNTWDFHELLLLLLCCGVSAPSLQTILGIPFFSLASLLDTWTSHETGQRCKRALVFEARSISRELAAHPQEKHLEPCICYSLDNAWGFLLKVPSNQDIFCIWEAGRVGVLVPSDWTLM